MLNSGRGFIRFEKLMCLFLSDLFSSAKPQEYNARLEKRHEAKKEVLGQSKQAEFVQLMEQEVEYQPGSVQDRAA